MADNEPLAGKPVVLSPPTYERHEMATRYVEGLIQTRAPRESRQRSPGAAWHAWGLLPSGETITGRDGLTLGEGDVIILAQEGAELEPTEDIVHVYNGGDAITADTEAYGYEYAYDSGAVLLLAWTNGYWSVAPTTTATGGGGGLERCDCPEESYEVDLDCGECHQKMPRFWIVTIVDSQAAPYEEECESTPCIEITAGNQVTIEHTDDPYDGYGYGYGSSYGGAECTWVGEGSNCVLVELTLEDDEWHLRVYDKSECLLAHYKMDAEDFACCGVNAAWERVEGACAMTLRVAPHPCTCCPPEVTTSDCGCAIQDPDRGEAAAMEFTVGGIVDGMPCNCGVANNQGGSKYHFDHAGPDSCQWVGNKIDLEDGEVNVSGSIGFNGADGYFYLNLASGCFTAQWRCHQDDFDCCTGGTFVRVTPDWRENPSALCATLSDTIAVTGIEPCCD